ncbi:MAG TPA: DUF2268 domain-containing protein [Bacillota bacterium]|nr:DUF2268 domain-containing protein [Bacillota bacterium]
MGVVQTDKWLNKLYDKPVELCKKLSEYFNGIDSSIIRTHLIQHGMYQHPTANGKKWVSQLQKNGVWTSVAKEAIALKQLWNGPDIPIFILPADSTNQHLKQDHNGKSGLAFNDKLFLFVSKYNTSKEISALFTHEYHHVCRLSKFQKSEADYVLLDTIILEGLAENAVRERLGEHYVAPWTTYYTTDELEAMWNEIIVPKHKIPRFLRQHHDLLFGIRAYPKMVGYCVGYYLVKKYMEENNLTSSDIIDTPSEDIARMNHS